MPEIEKLNKFDAFIRSHYDKLKNQFDIIIQDSSTIFNVSENSNFVTYKSDDKIDEQGSTLRLEFTDTVETIKGKIRAKINAPEGAHINMIEVKLLQNSYCQLLNPLSAMIDD